MTLNADELRALLELAAKPDNLRAHGFLRTAELLEALPILLAERDALKARVKRLERSSVTVTVAPINGETACHLAPDGRHQVDTSMEEGPNNCFHCGAYMGRVALKGDEQ